MLFSSFLFLIALALTNLNFPAKADIVAFSGNLCDGAEGSNVACDDSCIAFSGRHSFRVLAPGTHCVTLFLNTGCADIVGHIESTGNGACNNVNTGTDVRSFRCGPNSVCPT